MSAKRHLNGGWAIIGTSAKRHLNGGSLGGGGADDDPVIVVFGPSHQLKKKKQSWTPPLTKLSRSAHDYLDLDHIYV